MDIIYENDRFFFIFFIFFRCCKYVVGQLWHSSIWNFLMKNKEKKSSSWRARGCVLSEVEKNCNFHSQFVWCIPFAWGAHTKSGALSLQKNRGGARQVRPWVWVNPIITPPPNSHFVSTQNQWDYTRLTTVLRFPTYRPSWFWGLGGKHHFF